MCGYLLKPEKKKSEEEEEWRTEESCFSNGTGALSSRMLPVILTVYLNDTQQMLTEVPVTPATRVIDVVEYCKEAGEGECHLAEVWNGHERVLPLELLLLDLLQQWGARRPEVSFYLRHCPSWTQGSQQPLEQSWTTEATESANDRVPRVELTLSELQEMATRQQQQIEAQQQMLVAKEQRLRYLHQGGRANQGQTQSEAEKLQRLKERVETQEAKLKKIRAMRGQVDYSKLINGNLSAEIDHVSSLFQEKQAELQSAVVRVDQLTQQLEDLRRGRLQLHSVAPAQGAPAGSQGAPAGQKGSPLSGPAALELRKLYQELQARNRHNLEQSSKLAQNKELLNKRNAQVTVMDQRIGDLRERLHKKRAELSRMNGGGLSSPQTSSHPGGGVSGRVAAVCPYIQVPADGRQEAGYNLPADPPAKPTPLSHIRSLSANEASWPSISKSVSDWKTNSPEQHPSGYGTYPSATHQAAGHHCATSSLPRSAPGTLGWPRSSATSSSSSSSSSSQQIQQRISVPPNSSQGSASTSQPSPLSPQTERTDPPPAVAVRPYVPDHPSRPQSPRKGPATMNSSSIYSMYLQHPQAKNYGSLSNRTTVKAVYGKPILPTSSTSPSPVPFLQGGGVRAGGEDVTDKEGGKGGGGESSDGQILPPPSVDNIPRPLSPTKLTPVAHSQLRYQSDADLEVLRRRLSNAPRPLKKRSSITEPEGPQGPNIQKLLYQRFNTLAGGMEGGSGNTFYQPECILGDMDNIHSSNGNVEPGDKHISMATVEGEVQNLNSGSRRLSPPSVAIETSKETTAKAETTNSVSPSAQPSPSPTPDRPEDQNNNNQRGSSPTNTHKSVGHASPSPSPPAPPSLPKVKRTNLKKPSSERTGHGLRVKFNPLALLLDASLEGEFDLVQRIIYEVENPSMPNDEGITPLHNAVCAGHHHIVKFLLDFGVNVNAADSDGWTPLHCAASCNSVHLCKMLVESGAAIFATTISDVETAADKCEEMEEGYTQCSQFLYGVQEKLGVMNKGLVYALWDYTAQQADELSFSEGDALTVLRRRDDTETEWWWARLNDREGYVPRNLLGLYPRIKPRQRSLA
ncbi:protein phosphatase 1, regulatory subunit 13Ba isoform X2 [Chelmon rostratus]|uniref:protein phosphatase 1, regulatory subunit 13Ba isoform X2 n=1 Tax=Chelmon rostratus TaxID=109905 RepID=UPI001BE7EBAF|nr:protein phosphatase 1, regulatory subunit 13Ba isoform X2 [Chelmon rostratus]